MLLEVPEISIFVYSVTDEAISLIGEVNDASSVLYTKRFKGYGTLEMYVPLTNENVQYCKVGNMLCIGSTGRYCYFILGIQPQKDENGFVKIKVVGRSLECILANRILYTTHKYTNKALSYVMYNMVDVNFISVTDSKRRLSHLELEQGAYTNLFGPVVTLQRLGKSVKDREDEICENYEYGYEIYFDIKALKFIFRVLQPVNKTYNSGVQLPIIFDTETDDVLQSTYNYNAEAEKNVALVVGEAQDSTEKDIKVRAKVVVGNDTLAGYQRKEMYIDARDLQSESESDSGSVEEMSQHDYEELLRNRGSVKLSENAVVQTLEASIRYYGSQYEYDVDYTVGDIVTIVDRDINVMVNASISEVEIAYSDTYEIRLTIGTGVPTLYSKIKAML